MTAGYGSIVVLIANVMTGDINDFVLVSGQGAPFLRFLYRA